MTVVRLPKSKREAELVAAVDVGASKAVCLIAVLASGPDGAKIPEIVGAGLQGAAQKDGRSAGEAALRAAVDAAERMAQERVRGVFAAAPGRSLHCRRIGAEIAVQGGRVTREDVAECLAEAATSAAPDGYRALHAAPIAWRIDGEDAGRDPAGLSGSLLSAELLGVGARESRLVNLESVVERAGLRVEGAFAGPIAAAEATLTEDEKELGCVLLDLGAGSTSFAVYERGALVDCGGVPVGGEHVTRDIAQVFGAPLAQAERVKTLYGAAHVGANEEHLLLDMRQLGDEDEIRISRADLSAVISPRIEEIFELTARRLAERKDARRGVRRAVLTGGGSLLVGARESAERVLALKARLGRPSAIAGAPDAATAPQFSVCAGLIQLAAREKARARGAVFARPVQRVAASGVLAQVGAWLKDNF